MCAGGGGCIVGALRDAGARHKTVTTVTYPCGPPHAVWHGKAWHAPHTHAFSGAEPEAHHSSAVPNKEPASAGAASSSSVNTALGVCGADMVSYAISGGSGSGHEAPAEAVAVTCAGSVALSHWQSGSSAMSPGLAKLAVVGSRRGGSGGDHGVGAEIERSLGSGDAGVRAGRHTGPHTCEDVVEVPAVLEQDGSPVRSCISEPPSVRMLCLLRSTFAPCTVQLQ